MEIKKEDDMARKDIPPGKKPKPLTKKERKERKRKRKEKHVYEWLFFGIFLSYKIKLLIKGKGRLNGL